MKNRITTLLSLSFVAAVIFMPSLFAGYDSEEEGFISKLPCDLSYMVVDLKYNKRDGVQICEIQQGRASRFIGLDFIQNRSGVMAKALGAHLQLYHHKGWMIGSDIRDPFTVKKLAELGWKSYEEKSDLVADPDFTDQSGHHLYDSSSIHQYAGILYAKHTSLLPFEEFCSEHPEILVLDAATYGYCGDKLIWNQLFTTHPYLVGIKPKWGLYPKEYSEDLLSEIKEKFGEKPVVIKPRRSAKGYGVIIAASEDLEATLKYILSGNVDLLLDPDLSYRYWAFDRCDSFIVEEYIPSDPVLVDHLEGKSYDGTMRVAFLIAFDCGHFTIHYLGSYWKLPARGIDEEGTLNDRHKSCGLIPYFAEVEPEIERAVHKQLNEGMVHLFEEMLGH